MKTYKEVEMFAKNAPTGSYAAGCPTGSEHFGYWYRESDNWTGGRVGDPMGCRTCEVAS